MTSPHAINHALQQAERHKDNKIGTAFMVMSGALLLLMLVREGRELFVGKPDNRHFSPQPMNEYQSRNLHKLQTRCYDRDEACRHRR